MTDLATDKLHEAAQKEEEAIRGKIIEYYRKLHSWPELSCHEEKTAAFVSRILTELGIEHQTGVNGHGVVGLIRDQRGAGPVVGVRCDMDALEMTEETGVSYASQNKGVMHACGHDTHVAILLGTAHVLAKLKDHLKGSVKLIFQPAEEYNPIGGAKGMIAEGVLENPKVDAMLSLHVRSSLKTGTVALQAGRVTANTDRFEITVHGKAAHGAEPHRGVDAIVAASACVMAIQSVVARRVDPSETAVVTLGTVHGGQRRNIIPARVDFDGVARSFSPETRELLSEIIPPMVRSTCEAFGATGEVNYMSGYLAVLNDPKVVELSRKSVLDAGILTLAPTLPPSAGGEDFSFFAEKVPSAYAWLGCCPENIDPKDNPPAHNEKFLPDEKCLSAGISFLAGATLELLENF